MLASVGHFEAKSVVYGVQISVIAILGKQRFGINLLLLPVYCVITIVLLGHSGYNADSGVYFKSGLPLLGGHGPSRYLGNDTLTPGLRARVAYRNPRRLHRHRYTELHFR